MIRTYKEAVRFLEKYIPSPAERHPGKLGLWRMRYLVNLLNNPQKNFKSVHVGGTSGKGSTAAITASILAGKYKTGLHTSPHLERVTERIAILGSRKQKARQKNGQAGNKNISEKNLISTVNEVRPAIEIMEKSKIGAPSYFEIITALAFTYFKKENVDIAVIEVGMGGKFDATNIIKPMVSVITNVGLDHTEVLGNSVLDIARDKAGIIKSGIPVVTGVKQKSVVKIIESRSKNCARRADKQQARISLSGRDFKYAINKITDEGSNFDYRGGKKYKNLFIPLLGRHQVENSAVAIRTVEELSESGFSLKDSDIRLGLKNASISARLEKVSDKPRIYLDGAHNPDKMEALVETVKTIWPGKKMILVLAIKKGKELKRMLNLILPVTRKIILTEYKILMDQGIILSYKPGEIEKAIRRTGYQGEVKIEVSIKKALKEAIFSAKKEDIIFVTGSLYLTGLIKSNIHFN